MSVPKQHLILCEGYDDRSFWTGWLRRLDCTPIPNGVDAWGIPVKGRGRFLFRTPSSTPLVLHPLKGRDNAEESAQEYLGHRQAKRPTRVILNLDSDAADDTPGDDASKKIAGIATKLGAVAHANGGFEIDGSTLHGVLWECRDAPSPGLPKKQTLERLATAAILAAFPARGVGVDTWLEAPPKGHKLPKSYAWSYYAKWHADHGTGDFYESLWRDERIAPELEKRLRENGSWDVVEALVND